MVRKEIMSRKLNKLEIVVVVVWLSIATIMAVVNS
jgi:hypothetical protein